MFALRSTLRLRSTLALNLRPLTLLPTTRSLFIQSEKTPNPNSTKYTPGRVVYDSNAVINTFLSPDSAQPEDEEEEDNSEQQNSGYQVTPTDPPSVSGSPLGKRLLNLHPSVSSIYLSKHFLTVTKDNLTPWDVLNPLILGGIMDHYSSGEPSVTPPSTTENADGTVTVNSADDPDEINDDDDEVVAMIKELLTTRIRPSVQQDGGDIRYNSFDVNSGMVYVKLEGSCVGCPSSEVTLKNGVENMMMHYIPEVKAVVNVGEGGEEVGGPPEDHSEDEEEDAPEFDGEEWLDDMKQKVKAIKDSKKDEIKVTVKKQKSYEEKLRDAGIPFSD